MDAIKVITAILTLISGVGIFLIACSMMSSNLESLGSKRMKALFSKASKSKLVGVGVGAVTTAAIQSSSATTVMVIGFVNAGIMSLTQAATVIFGANIGTTVTGQIIALGMFGNTVSASVIFASLAGAGAFIIAFSKGDTAKKIGGIIAGFGMIFSGLSLMSGAMEDFAQLESVKSFLATIKNPLLLVLIGAIFTAAVQSSSVMTSVAITMTVTGLISLNQGIYITMGSNVGTCVTALIAGIASSRNAGRTALIHVIFNVSGAALFLTIGLFLGIGGLNFGTIFESMFPNAPQTQLAMFHTVFNVVTVLIILPLTKPLVKLVTKLLPDKKEKGKGESEMKLFFVDEHMLTTPPIAVQQTKKEILNMAEIAIKNFNLAVNIVCSLDYKEIEQFKANERELNFINKELFAFIVKLQQLKLSEKDRVYLSTAFRTVSDLERVGDYAENIVEYADHLKAVGGAFSEEALNEINGMKNLVQTLYTHMVKAYKELDEKALQNAMYYEERVDAITSEMVKNHVRRLTDGVCTADVGVQYLSLSSDAERIADHLINVAKTIKQYA